MALAITGIPDCRAMLGPSQWLRAYQLQPAASDYAAGGYTIQAAAVDMQYIYGAWVMGVNAAGIVYEAKFVPAAAAFGTNPAPQTSIKMVVGQSSGSGVPLALAAAVTSTNTVLTSNVATVTAPNTFKPGNFVVLQGMGNALFADLNGQIVQVITATAAQFTFNFTHANVTTGADTGTAQLVTSPSGGIISGPATVASTLSALTSNVGTITVANTFVPGNFVVLQGFTNAGATAFNGVIVQVITASATSFTFNFNHANIGSSADVGTAALVISPGGGAITTGAPAVVSNSVLTSNVGTLTAPQNFVPGELVVIQGLTNGAALNGSVQAVISTSLTNAAFKFNYKATNITTGADAGVAVPLVTGGTGEFVEVPASTDLSSMIWFAEFLGY